MKVIYSVHAGTWVTTLAQRTWRERLFTLPWKPWKSTKPVRYFEPISYITGKGTDKEVLVIHPSLKHHIETK